MAVSHSVRLARDGGPLHVLGFRLQARAASTALTEIGVRDGLRDQFVQIVLSVAPVSCAARIASAWEGVTATLRPRTRPASDAP